MTYTHVSTPLVISASSVIYATCDEIFTSNMGRLGAALAEVFRTTTPRLKTSNAIISTETRVFVVQMCNHNAVK